MVEIEKASFLLCCSRQNVPREWIGNALDCDCIIGLLIKECESSFMEIEYDDEWISKNKEKKIMYKVYVLGKIIKLDERCFRGKL